MLALHHHLLSKCTIYIILQLLYSEVFRQLSFLHALYQIVNSWKCLTVKQLQVCDVGDNVC